MRAEGNWLRDHAVTAIRKHKRFMKRHDPARCFSDAYAADRRIANSWLKQFLTGYYGSLDTATGRAIKHRYDVLDRATDAFTGRLAHRYFNDCR